MLKRMNHARKVFVGTLVACMTVSFSNGVMAKEVKTQPTSYQTVTKVEDWGTAITKVIIDLGRPIPVNSVSKDTFNVHVERSDSRLMNPFVNEGYRNVVKAHVSDKNGKPAVASGKHVVLEMEIGPTLGLGSAMNNVAQLNNWTENKYTITQQQPIQTRAGTIDGLVVDTFSGGVRELVDEFSTGEGTYGDVTLTYADFEPKQDNGKNPLIIWLHGAAGGGTDSTVPLASNKVVNFATDEINPILVELMC